MKQTVKIQTKNKAGRPHAREERFHPTRDEHFENWVQRKHRNINILHWMTCPPVRGLSRNGVKNYSKGPCVTILE